MSASRSERGVSVATSTTGGKVGRGLRREDRRANAREQGKRNQAGMTSGARDRRPVIWTRRLLVWGQFLGILVGAIGWWLPWVLHPSGAAALVLLGLDLGEFFKFTSLWQQGALQWERQFFYLPPVIASLALSTLVAGRRFASRWLLAMLAVFLAVVVLPPYPYRSAVLFSAEFQFQTWSALVAFGAVAVALVAPHAVRPPGTALRVIRFALGLAGFALPLWAFWRVQLILDGLYGRPVVVGPGLFVTLSGFALLAVTGLRSLIQPRRASAPHLATAPASSTAEQGD